MTPPEKCTTPGNNVSLREYLEALRISDQRAIELLAKHNSDRIRTSLLVFSLLVSIGSIMVAIAAIIISRH